MAINSIINHALLLLALVGTGTAFQNECNSNLVSYWGQNSYGAANPNDQANWQKPLRAYCDENTVDMFPIAFLTTFFSTGGKPTINLANECNSVDNHTFPGTQLANCTAGLQEDIKYCQSRGKALTLSLGGATGGAGFSSDEQAAGFADTIWNDFLGGSSNTRPFGNAILDGIDLDIEGGGASHYPAFLHKLKSYLDNADKKYYVTAAPQCVFPDANLQTTINQIGIDAVFVQFYNNPCGLQAYGRATQWNFGMWDYWARHVSPNPNVKVYIGAPASNTAAGGGYVPFDTLQKITRETRSSFPSFGGVMFWDTSQAHMNNRLDKSVKDLLMESHSCNPSEFVYPPCDAPAWDHSGRTYSAGNRVSYNSYIWEAKWSAGSEPTANPMGEWAPVSACANKNGTATPISSPSVSASHPPIVSSIHSAPSATLSHTMSISLTTTKIEPLPSTTTIVQQINPLPGTLCDSIQAWSHTKTYVSGSTVTYQNQIWMAKWWTYGDVPGGPAGVWATSGSCTR
ncbi:glycoside hydrolase [Fennellomyces sp. T-0311]|nr:glycoside hydrolase [Fennellomyces sp. T-0311]